MTGSSKERTNQAPQSGPVEPQLGYRADIDGLRAVAIISVLVFHAFPDVLPGGFVGVDIFFVISGYLITRIIHRAQLRGSFSLQIFYIHRVRRILPALIVVIAACLLAGKYVLLSEEFRSLGAHTFAGSVYLSNLLLITESGYFDVASSNKPLLHLWSLSVEEQFYLLWPLLIILAVKWGISVQRLILTLLITSFVFNVLSIDTWPTGTFYSPFARAWELLSGSGLAVLELNRSRCRDARNGNLLASVGLALITWSLIAGSKGMPMPGWWAVLPTAGAACLIAAGDEAWLNQRILKNRILVFVGLISYPLYLWHWPLLSFAQIVEGQQPDVLIRLTLIAIGGLLAWLTYWLIEKPIRHLSSWRMAASLIAALSMTGLLGAVVYLNAGFPKEGALKSASDARFEEEQKWNTGAWSTQNQCPESFDRNSYFYCVINDPQKPPTALLVGDSNANHFYPGLSSLYARHHENLLNLGKAACPPLFGIRVVMVRGDLHCTKPIEEALQYAMDQPSVKTVILSMLDVGYAIGRKSVIKTDENFFKLSQIGSPDADSHLTVMEHALRETFSRLTARNKQVILMLGIPMLDFDPARCVDMRPWRITSSQLKDPCAMPQQQVDALSEPYRSMVHRVAQDYPLVKLIDAAKELCDGTYCWAMKDGRMLYRDREHLSVYGSSYLTDKLSAQFLP